MKFEELTIKATQDEIIERMEQMKGHDFPGEYGAAFLLYLDFEHAKPYVGDGPNQEDVQERYGFKPLTGKEWWEKKQKSDSDLGADLKRYVDWWREKIETGQAISVHLYRAQVVNRLFLAGMPQWKEIGIDYKEGMDGGWYQEDAYNKAADLFDLPHVKGFRGKR